MIAPSAIKKIKIVKGSIGYELARHVAPLSDWTVRGERVRKKKIGRAHV